MVSTIPPPLEENSTLAKDMSTAILNQPSDRDVSTIKVTASQPESGNVDINIRSRPETNGTVAYRQIGHSDDETTNREPTRRLGPSNDMAEAKTGTKTPAAENLDDSGVPYKVEIVWFNVTLFVFLHLGALYGLYLMLTRAKLYTWLFVATLHVLGGFGITGGAHRLWAHRSYKANLPCRIMIMLFNCIALQNDVIEWSRDHRVHHKFSETDADPHNAKRGFFFSHMGWLMCKKHSDVKRKGANVDISDLMADPVLRFQRKYYLPLVILMCFVAPSLLPTFWGESIWVAYFVAGALRYTYTLHMTWTVNSLAHMWGYRPYDKEINPRENLTSTVVTMGEGWHNYHHTFPFDYRASEWAYRINLTTILIDGLALIGWVKDRKVVSQKTIDMKKARSGDHSNTWSARATQPSTVNKVSGKHKIVKPEPLIEEDHSKEISQRRVESNEKDNGGDQGLSHDEIYSSEQQKDDCFDKQNCVVSDQHTKSE